MRIPFISTLVAFTLPLLVACGDGGSTETTAAIQNDSSAAVTVSFVSAESETVTFTDVAPSTTSDFQALAFTSLGGITVRIDSGSAMPGSITLTAGKATVVKVSDSAAPSIASSTGGGNGDDGGSGGFW